MKWKIKKFGQTKRDGKKTSTKFSSSNCVTWHRVNRGIRLHCQGNDYLAFFYSFMRWPHSMGFRQKIFFNVATSLLCLIYKYGLDVPLFFLSFCIVTRCFLSLALEPRCLPAGRYKNLWETKTILTVVWLTWHRTFNNLLSQLCGSAVNQRCWI